VQLHRELNPDVTLMDLQMPDVSGLDAIIAIKTEDPTARIIVLTTYSGDAAAQRETVPLFNRIVRSDPKREPTSRALRQLAGPPEVYLKEPAARRQPHRCS